MIETQWIEDASDLMVFVELAANSDRYALDTEFHREKTYFPQLALIQLRVGEQIALIDPIACDPKALVPLFESSALCVIHAAQQDLEVLRGATGSVPGTMFDTQIAAGFLGMSTPSLSTLVQSTTKVVIPKGDRLTDWLRRPLTDAQKRYAASDVEYLLQIHDRQRHRLDALGRLPWVEIACEDLRVKPMGPIAPESAWMRVKDVRTLKGESRGVAQAVAEWRERRAMQLDIPPRRVLSDMALLVVATAMPRTIDELGRCRGVDIRSIGPLATDVLEAVARGRDTVVRFPPTDAVEVDQRFRSVVPLVMAWISELARAHEIDPTLLATRQDVDEFVAGVDTARLRHGWRRDIVGSDLMRILDGSAGLHFDGQGRLLLAEIR
jgi:ribonuclease D